MVTLKIFHNQGVEAEPLLRLHLILLKLAPPLEALEAV